MIVIIQELLGIYEQENAALEKAKARDFQALQENKMFLARRYEQAVAQIIARREEMKSVAQNTRAKLTELQEDFGKIATRNRQLIERMNRAVNRLGDTIRTAATDAVAKRTSAGYGKDGAIAASQTRNMSIGINETI